MIAAFYGGELVWRERDRKLNELINSTPVPSWVMTVPKILAIFVVLLCEHRGDGRPACSISWSKALTTSASRNIRLVHRARRDRRVADRGPRGVRPGAEPQQICRLGNPVRLVRRYDLPQEHGLFEPTLHLRHSPIVPLSDFVGAGSFWKGEALRFYWLCFAVILAVLAHLLWPRGTDLGLGVRLKGCGGRPTRHR